MQQNQGHGELAAANTSHRRAMFNADALVEPGAGRYHRDELLELETGLVMRPLDASDFDKGYVALLGQVGPPNQNRCERGSPPNTNCVG